MSIVYQGGGARIADLIAAVDAIKRFEAKHADFEVTRVSGSSAGAIAAAIHASNANIDKIILNREKLSREVALKIGQQPFSFLRAVCRLGFGQPVVEQSALRSVIRTIFDLGDVDVNRPIKELMNQNSIIITKSDLNSGNSIFVDEKSTSILLEDLVDSCSIPFVFSTPKGKPISPHIIDGGVFQNLPVLQTLKCLDYNEKILAISFQSKNSEVDEKTGLKKYFFTLIDALIDERVKDSISEIGSGNVITIPSKNTTLGFSEAMGDSFYDNYSAVKKEVDLNLQKWRHRIQDLNGPDWFSTIPRDMLEQYRRTDLEIDQFASEVNNFPLHLESAIHKVFYGSCHGDTVPDVYTLELKMLGEKNPGFQFIKFSFYDADHGETKRTSVTLECLKGESISYLVLPLRNTEGKRVISVLLCLSRPLCDGDVVIIKKTEESYLCMRRYTTDGYINEVLAMRKGAKAERMGISVHFPKGFGPAVVRNASFDYETDVEFLKAEDGLQLSCEFETGVSDSGGTWHHSSARALDASDRRRYLCVSYLRKGARL